MEGGKKRKGEEMEIWELVIREFYFGVSGIYKKPTKIGEDEGEDHM